MTCRPLLSLACCVLTALAFTAPAQALSLTPLAQYVDASTTTGVLRVMNNTKASQRYQITVDLLTLGPDGQKVRTPSTGITFYPAIIELQPGQTQAVRWKRNATSPQETVYWVSVLETPTATPVPTAKFNLVRPMEIKFPWVFTPPGLTPSLSAQYANQQLVLRNNGTAAARVSNVVFGDNKSTALVLLLPGERVSLPMQHAAPSVRLTVGRTETTLTVE